MVVAGIYDTKYQAGSGKEGEPYFYVTFTTPAQLSTMREFVVEHSGFVPTGSDGKQKLVVHCDLNLIILCCFIKRWDAKHREIRTSAVPIFFALAPTETAAVVASMEQDLVKLMAMVCTTCRSSSPCTSVTRVPV